LLRYSTFCAFHVFLVYIQIRSAYSLYKNGFFPGILSIWTDSFHVFCKCVERILLEDWPHSAFSPFTYKLILRILSIRNQIWDPQEKINYFALAFEQTNFIPHILIQ
jgi:hypothetical protein